MKIFLFSELVSCQCYLLATKKYLKKPLKVARSFVGTMNLRASRRFLLGLVLFSCFLSFKSQAESYTLYEAIKKAQSQDVWIDGSLKRQESLSAMSIQSGTLPDPRVSLGVANLPIDNFDFSQEPMTQFKVSVSQMLPRGKSRSLKRERLEQLSQEQPFARKDRYALVEISVTHLWLEALRSQKTIDIIKKDQDLFDHLVDVAESSYASTSSRTRQQNFIRAQLERTRLDDRLTQLQQNLDVQVARLGEWLFDANISINSTSDRKNSQVPHHQISRLDGDIEKQFDIFEILNSHPQIKSIDKKINALNVSVEIAEQQYKPQWGINASYGYRDQDFLGRDRADFLSIGVTFDVPLFTGNRQDKQVQAAKANTESIKIEKTLQIHKLKAGYDSAKASYTRLIERKKLFDERLLREMNEQAESSLTAYTNDDGDFAEVVRARIAELNARIEVLNIEIDSKKSIAQINYYLAGTPTEKHVIDQ